MGVNDKYFDERDYHYAEWVRINREANRLPIVVGEGPPVKPLLNYGRWIWICHCNAAYSIPAEGDVACVYCECETWHEVDRSMIDEVELDFNPPECDMITPRYEMHWRPRDDHNA